MRGKISIGLVIYGWVMFLIDFGLQRSTLPAEGPDRGLAEFRQVIMGRGALALGAATVLAALILSAITWRKAPRNHLIAIVAGLAWVATVVCLGLVWPQL